MASPYGSGMLHGAPQQSQSSKKSTSGPAAPPVGEVGLGLSPNAVPYGYAYNNNTSLPSGAYYPGNDVPGNENGEAFASPESPTETPSFNFSPLNMDTGNKFFSLRGTPLPNEMSLPSLSSKGANNMSISALGSNTSSGGRGGSRSSSAVPGKAPPQESPKGSESAVNVGSPIELHRLPSLSGEVSPPPISGEGMLPGFAPITHQKSDDFVSVRDHTAVYDTPNSLDETTLTKRFTGSPATGAPLSSVNSNIVMGSVFPTTPKRAPIPEGSSVPPEMPPVPAPPKSFAAKATTPLSDASGGVPAQSIPSSTKPTSSLKGSSGALPGAAADPSTPTPVPTPTPTPPPPSYQRPQAPSSSSTLLSHVTTPTVSVPSLSTSGALTGPTSASFAPALSGGEGDTSIAPETPLGILTESDPTPPPSQPVILEAEYSAPQPSVPSSPVPLLTTQERVHEVPPSATVSVIPPPELPLPSQHTSFSSHKTSHHSSHSKRRRQQPSLVAESAVSQPFSPTTDDSLPEPRPRGSSKVYLEDGVAVPSFAPYTPLVAQHNYRKTDIKLISSSSDYTFEQLQTCEYVLEPIKTDRLLLLEPNSSIRKCYQRMSKVKSIQKKLEKEKKRKQEELRKKRYNTAVTVEEKAVSGEKPLIRPLTVEDVSDGLVAYDNVMPAISFALFGTVAYTNDLIEAAEINFKTIRDSRLAKERLRKQEEKLKDDVDWDQDRSSSSGTYTDLNSYRLKITVDALFRWLNDVGVDVLVVSEDRRAAASFGAKRCNLRRNGMNKVEPNPSPVAPLVSESANDSEKGRDRSSCGSSVRRGEEDLKRILVVLEYDLKKKLWSPLTISEPIRDTARYLQKEHRRRKREKQIQRIRDAQKQEEKERMAALEAQRNEWVEKNRTKEAQWKVEHAAAAAVNRENAVLSTDGGKSPYKKESKVKKEEEKMQEEGNQIPFSGFVYPNLVQTDCGLISVLKQSTHSLFTFLRLKLFLGVAFSILGLTFAIATLVFTKVNLSACVYSDALGNCTEEDDALSTGSCVADMKNGLSHMTRSLSTGALFGTPVAGGNTLLVALSLQFVFLLFLVLLVFMATRFMATKSEKPCFFHLLHGLHVLIAVGMCGFSTYSVYSVKVILAEPFPCASLNPQSRVICQNLSEKCASSGVHYRTPFRSPQKASTAFALSLLFTIFCGGQLLLSLLPLLPRQDVQDRLHKAVPDTIAFQPNYYAPDGLYSSAQRRQVQDKIRPIFKKEVRHQIKKKERLLTHGATIGQMMQVNREQSLKRMQLKKRKELPHRRGKGRRRGQMFHHTRYAVQNTSEWEEESMDDSDDHIVLPPDMLQQIETISSTVKHRTPSATAPKKPEGELSWSDPKWVGEPSPTPSIAMNPLASFRRQPTVPRPRTPPPRPSSAHNDEAPPTVRFSDAAEEEEEAPKRLSPIIQTNKDVDLGRRKSSFLAGSPSYAAAGEPRRKKTGSFINTLPSFRKTLEPNGVRPVGAAIGDTDGPKPRGEVAARINPFVRNTHSDRIQRRDLMDLEPQISRIAARLQSERDKKTEVSK